MFEYDAAETTGIFSNSSSTITCFITFSSYFKANTRYKLEARPMIDGSQLLLTHDNTTQRLDYPQVNNNCMLF